MKVGDLVKYRYFDIIALVVDTTRRSYVFEVFQLSGHRLGVYRRAIREDWEVISESR